MDFYVIDKKRFISKFAYADVAEPQNLGAPDYCTSCNTPISLKKWLPPYKVVFEKPVYGDFTYGSYTEMLVSERFMESYNETNLKWILAFYPVEICKVKRKKSKNSEPPPYYKIDIIRTNTLIDQELSQFIREFDDDQSFCKI